MKVYQKHSNITQNMHGASRNYRYVWDVSVPSLYSVFSSCNRPYMMILMGSINLISGMALKSLFIFGKHSFGLDIMHVFSSSNIAKTFMLLCLKCYVDKEDNLKCYASFNVYALYCLHLSHHQLSGLSKPC